MADVNIVEDREIYALVANIPSFYHSADLRNYFSQFVEQGGFECFHFRHRPEIIRTNKDHPHSNSLVDEDRPNDNTSSNYEKVGEGTSDNTSADTLLDGDKLNEKSSAKKLFDRDRPNDNSAAKTVVDRDKPNDITSADKLVDGDKSGDNASVNARRGKSLCCVVRLRQNKYVELVRMYHRKCWLDRKAESMRSLCFISKIKVADCSKGENISASLRGTQSYRNR